MRDDDELIEVKLTDSDCDIILVTKLGQCIRFKETDVRPTGRSTTHQTATISTKRVSSLM